MGELAEMMARHARPGRVAWIGCRAARRSEIVEPEAAWIGEHGLEGDHARPGKRAVTLIQSEHLPVIAALLGRDTVPPALLRRNVSVSGLNLAGIRKGHVQVGDAVLQVEGPCPPCSRMEEALGFGGYTALRGHGGYYASVVRPGRIALGSEVAAIRTRR